MGHLLFDTTALRRVLRGVGLDRHGERLPGVAGIQAHRHRASGAHTLDAAGGPLDVGRVDVAAGHDDDVLDAAADHDVALLGQVAEVAGVVPAVLVLCRDEAAHGQVAGGEGLPAQLDHPDTTGRQNIAVLVDDAGLEVLKQRAEGGQPAHVALARGHRAAQRGEQVGVDLVDHQTGAAFGERHRQGGLGHAVGRQDGFGRQPERLTGFQQVLDVSRLDRFGAGERETQCGQIEFARLGLPA